MTCLPIEEALTCPSEGVLVEFSGVVPARGVSLATP